MKYIGPISIAITWFLFSCHAVHAQNAPGKQFHAEGTATSNFASNFDQVSIGRDGNASDDVNVYLTVGKIQSVFDIDRFRPDGAIMPTNLNLNFRAAFPTTQKYLVERVSKYPNVLKYLVDAGNSERIRRVPGASIDTAVMTMASDAFTVGLAGVAPVVGEKVRPFPATVCFVATDYPKSGSGDKRDLFVQSKVRVGIAKCLRELDERGVKSVALPLIGAASNWARDSDRERAANRRLLRCRLINAVSGISLGIGDFVKESRSIIDINIVQWDDDIQSLKNIPAATVSEKAVTKRVFEEYNNNVRTTFRRGLQNSVTRGSDIQENACNSILGFPNE